MRTFSLGALLLVLCLGSVLPTARAGELVDRVVAVVNKDVILWSELQEMVEYVSEVELRGLEGTEREEAREGLALEILDGLIGSKLLEQAMDRADIEVTDREVQGAIADVAQSNNITVERLFEELERQGIDLDEYRAEIRKQIRQYSFMNLEIRGRVSVSEEEIQSAWLQRSAAAAPEPAWRLQRLLLAFPKEGDEAARDALRAEASALLEELRAGKDFAEVARARSDDPSTREKGGDAGLFRSADLGPAFAAALEGTELGDVVRVELPTGIFLLRIAEVVDTAQKAYEEVHDALARELYDAAMEREMGLWSEEQRRRAHVEIFM